MANNKSGKKDSQSMTAKLPRLECGANMIIALQQENKAGEIHLSTHFESLDENGMIIAGVPMRHGIAHRVPPGDMCFLEYVDTTAIYRVECRVDQYENEDELRFIKLEMTGGVERIQRRNSFRLPVSMPCRISLFEIDENLEFNTTVHEAEILDISVGGLRILTTVPLVPGEDVGCSVVFANQGDTDLSLTVMWGEPANEGAYGQYVCGMKINSLAANQESAIARYILSEQRRRRNL